nr:hypothetical protein [Tanacetum cinerariifolium]
MHSSLLPSRINKFIMDTRSTLKSYKSLEADKVFLENLIIAANSTKDDVEGQQPVVLPYNADLIRLRQKCLRSYTFTRPDKTTLTQKANKLLIMVKNYFHMKIATLGFLSPALGKYEVG